MQCQKAPIPTAASRHRRSASIEQRRKGLHPLAVNRYQTGGGGSSRIESACLGRNDSRCAAVAAASALAGRFDSNCRTTTDRVERVSRRGRSSGGNCDRGTNRRISASLQRRRAVSIDCRASARAERSVRRRRRRAGGCPSTRRDVPDRCGDGRSGAPAERRRRSFKAKSTNRAAPPTARRFPGSRVDDLAACRRRAEATNEDRRRCRRQSRPPSFVPTANVARRARIPGPSLVGSRLNEPAQAVARRRRRFEIHYAVVGVHRSVSTPP
jgi:hypothetical protein